MYKQLETCPLFRGLTAEQIQELIEDRGDYTLSDYRAGEFIARRDTAYSGLMIVLKGLVRGEITYTSGKTVGIDALHPGELIAPAFLFGGYNRLPVDVIALSDVRILTLHRGYIFELMQNNMLILSNFIDIISNRANVWSKRIYFLSFRSLKEKVTTYLLDHTSEHEITIPVPDIAEIAACFDATRNAVTTVLADLEKRTLIRIQKETIEVLNRTGLMDILK